MQPIEFDGFDDLPGVRGELIAFINAFCAEMTLTQAREWYEDAFAPVPSGRP